MIYVIGIALVYLIKLVSTQTLESRDSVLARKFCIFFSIGVFFLIAALRGDQVGEDTDSYIRKFFAIQEHGIGDILTSLYTEKVEFGYALLNKLVGSLGGGGQAMLAVNSFIVCLAMARFLYCHTDSDITGLIVLICCGLYPHSLNGTRQIMAAMLLLNAWGELTEGKLKKSLLFFAAAFSFHITSIVFLVAYLLYFCKDRKKLFLLLLGATMVTLVFSEQILRFIGMFTSKFDSYLRNTEVRVRVGGIWLVWIVEIGMALFFLADYAAGKRLRERLPVELPHSAMNVQACISALVLIYIEITLIGTQMNFFDRFGWYFMGFTALLILEFEKVVKTAVPKLHKLFLLGVHVGFVALFFLSVRAEQYQYYFFWNQF